MMDRYTSNSVTENTWAPMHSQVLGPQVGFYKGWVEAVPILDTTARTVAGAYFKTWIDCFGTTARIPTDHCRLFESPLFKLLAHLLGNKRIISSPYHPHSNGIMEEWHLPLKAA
ncbi:integrase catalytic domain-containing protein [Trichonephila clavipes]|nr:integrase catalytic domain-containing protein [Trichonephila clavipes]